MNNISKIDKNNALVLIVKGYISAILISVISLFIFAMILVNTNVQESTIKPIVIVITAISILIGSSLSSLRIKKNGIVNGMCVGGIYLASLYIMSSIAFCGFSLNISSLITIVIGIVIGGVGGVIGVNVGVRQ